MQTFNPSKQISVNLRLVYIVSFGQSGLHSEALSQKQNNIEGEESRIGPKL